MSDRLTREKWAREQRQEMEKQELLGELVSMTPDLKRATITAAANYRSGNDSCGSVYMGSMAHANLNRALGGTYGKDGLHDLLTNATQAQLNAGLEVCWSYIAYMRQNPVARCPCCGGIVAEKTGKTA